MPSNLQTYTFNPPVPKGFNIKANLKQAAQIYGYGSLKFSIIFRLYCIGFKETGLFRT